MAGWVRPGATVISQPRGTVQMRRVYSPLAVALLIRLAKLRGESLHLAPLLTLVCVFLEHVLSQSASVRVCCCTCVYACVSAHKCYWPNSALCRGTICCGPTLSWYVWVLKGGMMGIKRKVKV